MVDAPSAPPARPDMTAHLCLGVRTSTTITAFAVCRTCGREIGYSPRAGYWWHLSDGAVACLDWANTPHRPPLDMLPPGRVACPARVYEEKNPAWRAKRPEDWKIARVR